MPFACFMATPTGRAVRIVAGLVLIALGIVIGGAGYLIAGVGLVPLAAGVTNTCMIAPLLRAPFRGSVLRR